MILNIVTWTPDWFAPQALTHPSEATSRRTHLHNLMSGNSVVEGQELWNLNTGQPCTQRHKTSFTLHTIASFLLRASQHGLEASATLANQPHLFHLFGFERWLVCFARVCCTKVSVSHVCYSREVTPDFYGAHIPSPSTTLFLPRPHAHVRA